ncbi:putative amino acid-binding protein [Vibrio phage vB_VspS_VS-ABTNL-3]|nr:putative amino acid-binding protein [Vibrio phage vB_VspS_VS-ABTNL-3]
MNQQILQALGMLPPGGDAITPTVNPPLAGVQPPAMHALMGGAPAANPVANPVANPNMPVDINALLAGGAPQSNPVADIVAQKTAGGAPFEAPATQAVLPEGLNEGGMAGEGGIMDLLQSPQGYMALLSMAAPLLSGEGSGAAINAGLNTYQGYEDKKEKAKQDKFNNQLLLDNQEFKKKGMELDAETLEWRKKDADADRDFRAQLANMDKETKLEIARMKRENEKALAAAKAAKDEGTMDTTAWNAALATAKATAPMVKDEAGMSIPGPVDIKNVYQVYNSSVTPDKRVYLTADTAAFNQIQKELAALEGNLPEQQALIDNFATVYGTKALPVLSKRLKSVQGSSDEETETPKKTQPTAATPPSAITKPITTAPPFLSGQLPQGSPLTQLMYGQ